MQRKACPLKLYIDGLYSVICKYVSSRYPATLLFGISGGSGNGTHAGNVVLDLVRGFARKYPGCRAELANGSRHLLHYQDRKWFPFKIDQLARGQRWFQKYDVWSLLFAWLPVGGDPFTFIGKALRYWVVIYLADVIYELV
jgi:hypothetical protein